MIKSLSWLFFFNLCTFVMISVWNYKRLDRKIISSCSFFGGGIILGLTQNFDASFVTITEIIAVEFMQSGYSVTFYLFWLNIEIMNWNQSRKCLHVLKLSSFFHIFCFLLLLKTYDFNFIRWALLDYLSDSDGWSSDMKSRITINKSVIIGRIGIHRNYANDFVSFFNKHWKKP